MSRVTIIVKKLRRESLFLEKVSGNVDKFKKIVCKNLFAIKKMSEKIFKSVTIIQMIT